jgi:hypothetical protein
MNLKDEPDNQHSPETWGYEQATTAWLLIPKRIVDPQDPIISDIYSSFGMLWVLTLANGPRSAIESND